MKQAFVGIDVGAREVVAAFENENGKTWTRSFDNDTKGHRDLRRCVTRTKSQVRVCLEATGPYHLDLAVALEAHPMIEVMVANPRATKDFARAQLQRSKTDKTDAASLLQFVQRMPFRPWTPPSPEALELRSISRHLTALARERAREKTRRVTTRSAAVQAAAKQHIDDLEALETQLLEEATILIGEDPQLQRHFDHLVSIRGIAARSAIALLGELVCMPQDMTARQWVAHAGLDPRHFESGSSVRKRPRISRVGNRRLRAALYMPAVVAMRHEPQIRAYYEHLIARGKSPMQAIVAIMRKLLHAIHGMLQSDQDFIGKKFFAMNT